MHLIEADDFPFEFLSQLAERESWRKEIHRPVYHVHKWWAKRLGSVFRGMLLGCALPEGSDLATQFYRMHDFSGLVVLDPFMGSGTTIGEAHKLSMTALGRDINPVAADAVKTAFGPMDRHEIIAAFDQLAATVGARILAQYTSIDGRGHPADVLYYFWVMQTDCPECGAPVDLFPSYIIARNAYPNRKPEIQILCPGCGDIFPGVSTTKMVSCRRCSLRFDPATGVASGSKATCSACQHVFTIVSGTAERNSRPHFRAYGKLVLTQDGHKEYLPADAADHAAYAACSIALRKELEAATIDVPHLMLEQGYNTRQAMSYGFRAWRDFFNDRQLLALGWLRRAIGEIVDPSARRAMATLFSGVLEFNNLFASYKGEGTGAVRHMFSHHILKPERTPIEANVWGTSKSSGSFSNLFRGRLLRAVDYRETPVEIVGKTGTSRVCSPAFSGKIEDSWPSTMPFARRGIYLSVGDSAETGLPDASIDMVVTDPPFFDNVHYSELADFFFAWQQLGAAAGDVEPRTTRSSSEVQDADVRRFGRKLEGVFRECERVLKQHGLLVFSYHHSRDDGWTALGSAILGAGFVVVNSHPVKAEMSVGTPKTQAKEPIQLDIILVCRRRQAALSYGRPTADAAIASAKAKIKRLQASGFSLSRNDLRVVLYGQMLTTLDSAASAPDIGARVDAEIETIERVQPPPQEELQRSFAF